MSIRDPLRAPKRGEAITSRFLNRVVSRIDALDNEITRKPKTSTQSQQTITNPGATDLGPLQLLDPDITDPDLSRGALGTVYTELSRLSSTVRVENPSDPAQFVDVERIDSVTLETTTGERMTLVFNN